MNLISNESFTHIMKLKTIIFSSTDLISSPDDDKSFDHDHGIIYVIHTTALDFVWWHNHLFSFKTQLLYKYLMQNTHNCCLDNSFNIRWYDP